MSSRGTESPDKTKIMKNFRIFYQLTNTINKIVYNFVEFENTYSF